MNKVQLIGFVGNDPKLKKSVSGSSCVQMNICTNEKGKRLADGTMYEDRTEWHKVMMWGRGAEMIADVVRSGNRIYVEGRLRNYTYKKLEDGVEHKSYYIVVDYFELLTSRKYPFMLKTDNPDEDGMEDNVTIEDVEEL